MQVIGRYIISGIFYPYQNAILSESLDRQGTLRFGGEFAHYIDSFIHTLRHQAGISPRGSKAKRAAKDDSLSAKGSKKKKKGLSGSEMSKSESSE